MISSIVNDQIVLFDQLVWPYQVLPLQFRVNMEVIAMKGYSTSELESPHHIVLCYIQDTL